MKKIMSLLLIASLIASLLVGCGASGTSGTSETPKAENNTGAEEESADKTEKMSIEVAGLSGGLNSFPVWIAEKNGWFDEENIDVNITYFENGPVQVEAISSWDIATTGIGGILSGTIAYDAQVIAASSTDDGSQMIYVRPDHPIAAAGQGHNSLDPEIYGDAESWKGATVLCSAGTVLQYMLIKVLEGFDLTTEDIDFVGMDTPTTNSAFLAGEGDVAVLTGVVCFAEDKEDYVMVSTGNMAQAGLDCAVIATEEAVSEKKEEIKAFLKAYLRATEWIEENKEAAVEDLIVYCDESGKSVEDNAAEDFINAETFYSVEDVYQLMNEPAEDADVCRLESRLSNVLKFFISAGNYSEGDDEKFAGHVNNEFINAIYEAQ